MAVIIKKVTENESLKKFVKFSIDLYKDNEYFVPPLVYDEMMTLNREKNPAFDHCDAAYFLAYRDNKIVGRIAVIINHLSNQIWEETSARFGFVDFINDNEVVDTLFHEAEEWAKFRGVNRVHGPLGFTDFDYEGLLVEGFDKLATMSARYYFPYYKEQIERIGYKKDQDWVEYIIKVPSEIPERIVRGAEVVRKRFRLTVKKIENKSDLKPYAHEIFHLLNKSYKGLYGFVPLTDRQIDYYVGKYIPMIRLDFLSVVMREEDNRIVGVGIGLPNLSRAMQKAKGKFMPTGWYHIYNAIKGKGNKWVDLLLIGIDPEYQGKGVNALIFNQFIEKAIDLGAEYAESNPELEINSKVQSLWSGFDARKVKTRRVYIKEL